MALPAGQALCGDKGLPSPRCSRSLAGRRSGYVNGGQGATIVPHSRHARAERTYRATLLAFSALTFLLTLFVVAIVEQDAVAHTIRAALQDVTALNAEETRTAAELT